MQSLIVHGLASNKRISLTIQPADLNKTLMDFLLEHQIPVASSCSGEGVCKKCVNSDGLLMCQITVAEYLKRSNEVGISYY